MKKKIGFYFDAQKSGEWNWDSFLRGDVGMNGTDSQLLLLVNDLSSDYAVYFFTNLDDKHSKKFETIQAANAEEAAVKAKELNIDLFIFNNKGNDNTINGINKLESLKMPFVLWDQNGPAVSFETLLSGSKYLKRIVAVSKTHANWHRHRKYFPKMTYIYNGKDYPVYNRTQTKVNTDIDIGFLGAVTESKGFHWVAKAWPEIKKELPGAKLIVIGSIKTHDSTRKTGELGIGEPDFENKYIFPYLGKTANELKKNGVSFTGHITPNQMLKYMPDLRLGIVNPNVWGGSNETFCVSAVDFQAFAVPVVGGNSGGLKETVSNRRTGILINSSDQLADAVIKLCSNQARLARLSGNCVTWVEHFSRKNIVPQWIKLINDVLSDKPNELVGLSLRELNLKMLIKELIRIKNKYIQ